MASGFSTATRNTVLNDLFHTGAPDSNTIWGALCDADPGDAGDMAGQEIAVGTDYARTSLLMATGANAGSIANTTALEFPPANGGNWGAITHLAIVASATEATDDMIASGSLTVSKTINDGDQLKFAIGNITVSIAVQA
jgi:hypothetical protein